MSQSPPPFDAACPNCGHTFTLAELKRMAVGDGWKRYVFVIRDGKRVPVPFDEFRPDLEQEAGEM